MFSANIDWANLAQQWIQMQNGGGEDPVSGLITVPPPPNISMQFPNASGSLKTFGAVPIAKKPELVVEEEKGEADMIMSDDEESVKNELKDGVSILKKSEHSSPIVCLVGENEGVMQPMQSQWFMHQPVSSEVGNVSKELEANATSSSAETIAAWSTWPANLPTSSALASTTLQTSPNPTAHIPSLMKLSVPNPNNTSNSSIPNDNTTEEAVCTTNIDAAKRKILPAWIRDGLEKMERAKQKEREQNKVLSSLEQEMTSESSTYKVTVKNDTVTHLASDDSSGNEGDDVVIDGNENVYRRKDTVNVSRRNSPKTSRILSNKTAGRDDHTDTDTDGTGNDNSGNIAANSEISGKSYEKKLADLMIIVRRTLTELLLEVTNEEISQLANEAIKSYKTKASSTVSVMIRNSALSSITGKLGLAAYVDTSSDEDNTDNVDSNDGESIKFIANENSVDSDEELKATIKSRHRTWAKISDEIEEYLATLADREEHQLKHYAQMEQQRQDDDEPSGSSITVGKNYERDFGETTETKLSHSNGNKRQKSYERKERTSRFTDNKDTSSSATSSITYIAQHVSQQNHQQQQQTIANPGNASLFPSIETMENYNEINAKRISVIDVQSVVKSKNSSKINKSKLSSASMESARRGKNSNEKDKTRRHRHTSKHKHRTSSRGRRKGQKRDSSVSTTASSTSESSSSTSSNSTNGSDNSSLSSNSHNSGVKHKKRKRLRSKSRSSHRSEKDRPNQHNKSREKQHSSEHSKQSSSSRYEKLERYSGDNNKHSHKRHHNQRRRHRHHSSESDDRSRSRSKSRSSYASSSRHYRR